MHCKLHPNLSLTRAPAQQYVLAVIVKFRNALILSRVDWHLHTYEMRFSRMPSTSAQPFIASCRYCSISFMTSSL